MRTLRWPPLFLLVLAGLLAGPAARARPLSDLMAPEKRKPMVDAAERLAKTNPPPPLPAELVNPFNPPAFGQPDPEELRALAAAAAAAQSAAASAKPSSDRDFLEAIAARITPSGTLILGGESWLVFGKKRLRVGDHFTVSYEGQDYDLELTAIERGTFTLRLNREEITRPLKPGKSS